MIVNKQLAENY